MSTSPTTLLLLLTLACGAGADAAGELTWKEANRRSSEALRAGKFEEGADDARRAFDLYPHQTTRYSGATHAQLLLNLIDARRRAEGPYRAVSEFDECIEVLEKRAGPDDPNLVAVWDEAAHVAGGDPRADGYYRKSAELAERMWGSDDARTIGVHGRWARDLRKVKGSHWATTKLQDARARAERLANNSELLFDIDLTQARVHLASQQHSRAIAAYEALIASLEAPEHSDKRALQLLYRELEEAHLARRDSRAAARVRQRRNVIYDYPLPAPIERTAPIYPKAALRSGIQGAVVLRITIAKDGAVKEAQVVGGDPKGVFDDAALAAVRRWKFSPTVVNGEPIELHGLQQLNFVLHKD